MDEILRRLQSTLTQAPAMRFSALSVRVDLVGGFLGTFAFAWTDYLKNYRSDDAEFIGVKVNISRFQRKELAHP